MKVRPKYFSYLDLPKAAPGMFMEPGPKIPGLKNAIGQGGYPERELFPSMPQLDYDPGAIISTSQLPAIDTTNAIPQQQPQQMPQNRQGYQGNFGNAALLGLAAFDALLPNRVPRQTVVQPQQAYNPMPYGNGSQALMEDGGYVMGEDENNSISAKNGNWIQGAVNPAHKGYCTPMTKSTCTPRRKALAKTFKKMAKNRKKEEGGFIAPGWDQYKQGGIIPDNMSNFYPHKYEYGGDVNGCAKVREVGPNYPNTDLMEQWLLYADGGPVDPNFQPSVVKDSANRAVVGKRGQKGIIYNSFRERDVKHLPNGVRLVPMGIIGGMYDINTPDPGYSPMNLNGRSAYSASFPEGGMQKTAYFPDQATLSQFANNNSGLLIDSQERPGRGSATLKNRPMKEGGNVNGSAKVRDVGAMFPNTDLLEQWLLYNNGGNVNGGAKIREVGPNYPNTDLMEQWLLYRNGGRAAAGDMLTGDPTKPLSAQENYYQSSAKLSYYKDQLNQKLKAKNPQGYQDFFKGLVDLRRNNNPAGANKYVQDTQYNDYLSPQEVQGTLGDKYDDYLNSIKSVNAYNVSQGQQPLYGNVEGENDLSKLNYGRRFASLQITPSYSASNRDKGTKYERQYSYDPKNNQVDFTESGDTKLRPDYLSERPAPTIRFKNGGVMYDDGGQVQTMWGGSADMESYNPYDGGTIEFNGQSHDDGGIGMQYNGNPIEVEGGEYASRDNEGNLNIYGNMFIPGTRTKFKKGAKAIAKKEKRYDFLKTKGSDLVNNSDPANRFDQLRFNSGKVMMDGGQMGMQDLASKKENLAKLQRSMLELAADNGLDPFEMSKGKMKKAKGGASIPFMANGGQDPVPKPKAKTERIKAYDKFVDDELKKDSSQLNRYDLKQYKIYKQDPIKYWKNIFDLKVSYGAKPEELYEEVAMLDDLGYHMNAEKLPLNKPKDTISARKSPPDRKTPRVATPISTPAAITSPTNPTKVAPSDPGGNDPYRSDRNMNPGNIKFGDFAKKYGAKRDKDGFAIFPDRNTGEKAMKDLLTGKGYKDMSASEAIRKWTGGNPYRFDLGPLTDKKIGEMDPDELSIVMGTMVKGEGTRYGLAPRPAPTPGKNTTIPQIPTTPFRPYDIPDVPLATPVPPYDPVDPVPPYDQLQDVPDVKRPSNVQGLGLNNVLGELYGIATNKVEPVPAQRYEPQLFTPYQISFQDRINANQSVFNAQSRAVGASNPAALGTLGAQKYQADQAVYADEFRTNQAISNDITNKNIALVNDANLKNLGIADTQMVRQSQARSKTREFNQMILNSLSDKYAKNSLENKRLAAYENLYDYRFVPTEDGGQKATYFGPNAMFNYEGRNTGGKAQDVRTISRYDAQGNLKGYNEYDESDLKEQQRMLDMEIKRRKMPIMPIQPLGK